MRGHRHRLDASVGASEPHDFAVHFSIARLATPKRPPHPAPNVRDDRPNAPPDGRETGELVKMICPTTKAENFFTRDWTGQIRLKRLINSAFWRRRFRQRGVRNRSIATNNLCRHEIGSDGASASLMRRRSNRENAPRAEIRPWTCRGKLLRLSPIGAGPQCSGARS